MCRFKSCRERYALVAERNMRRAKDPRRTKIHVSSNLTKGISVMVTQTGKEIGMAKDSLTASSALVKEFHRRYRVHPTEAVIHKLMYLVQRKSLIEKDKILFSEMFQAWRFGPVLPRIRAEFRTGNMLHGISGNVSTDSEKLISTVLDRYGELSVWDLSCLCHQELSWQIARDGLAPSENGNVKISINAMMLDVIHQKILRTRHET